MREGVKRMDSFNPRSRAGSDAYHIKANPLAGRFQSTLPRGERPHFAQARAIRAGVSIHAPARGATRLFWPVIYLLIMFQSTLPRGERPCRNPRATEGAGFQSTLPRGERRYTHLSELKRLVFQSTLPRGERPNQAGHEKTRKRFQSTLPRGERHNGSVGKLGIIWFQSTIPRGERLRGIKMLILKDFFPFFREPQSN